MTTIEKTSAPAKANSLTSGRLPKATPWIVLAASWALMAVVFGFANIGNPVGDFNIAPTDADNGDPAIVEGFSTHVSAPEREAFTALEQAGLSDVVRPLVPTGFTYWDYKQLRFPRNEGLRIDFILGSRAVADAVTDAAIHRNERKGEAPSDHVPVVVELDRARLSPGEDEADDDRPMIFG